MHSNAFMEVSSWSITGESDDLVCGKDSAYGMFDLASLEVEADNDWVRLEFRKVFVTDFSWSLDPASSADEAMKMETIKLTFETMRIEYCQQRRTGLHDALHAGSWNFANPQLSVTPIGDGS